jgi:hypothetical protein
MHVQRQRRRHQPRRVIVIVIAGAVFAGQVVAMVVWLRHGIQG